jgi:drug/metabolite transporter (DMT)-like permease
MIISNFFYPMGFVFASEQRFHPITTSLARGIAVVAVTYLIGWRLGIDLTFKSGHNFKWQIVRNPIMLVQSLVYAWILYYLPLPVAITLQSTSPIFTAIFDKILNGVDLNRRQRMWLVVAFLGVVLTANGTYLSYLWTGKTVETNSKFENYFSTDPSMLVLAALAMTATMFVHGYGVCVTKKLRESNSIHVNYFQGIIILLVSALLAPFAFNNPNYHKPDMYDSLLALLFSGLPMCIGQLCFVGSLFLTHNYGMLTPFMFTSIIWGYLVSIFRYGEAVNLVCLTGSIAIVVGIVSIVRCKDRPA